MFFPGTAQCGEQADMRWGNPDIIRSLKKESDDVF
jgi:hypothetical protein